MTEQRIAVEAHLGVENEQIAVLGFDQRVDLEHLAIEIHEGGVELLGQLLRLLVEIARQLERKGDRAAVMRHEALRGIDGDGRDLVGRVVRHVLDVHPAFGRNDHRDLTAGAIDQHREVVFRSDIDAVGDVEAIDLLAFVSGLDRHQRVAEHLAGVLLDVLDAVREPHAALGIGLKFLKLSLAATAGMDLRLDHIERPGQLLRRRDRFLDIHRRVSGGNGDAVLGEEFLGLIFMDVHWECPCRAAKGGWKFGAA